MNKINDSLSNQETTAKDVPSTDTAKDEIPLYSSVNIKELMAKAEIQEAIRRYVNVPKVVVLKELRSPFENKETHTTTQKIKAISGTTIEDAAAHELTLLGTGLPPKESVNKKYRILDYTLGLEANMSAGKFGGYSTTGLKLVVTKLEEIKENEK